MDTSEYEFTKTDSDYKKEKTIYYMAKLSIYDSHIRYQYYDLLNLLTRKQIIALEEK